MVSEYTEAPIRSYHRCILCMILFKAFSRIMHVYTLMWRLYIIKLDSHYLKYPLLLAINLLMTADVISNNNLKCHNITFLCQQFMSEDHPNYLPSAINSSLIYSDIFVIRANNSAMYIFIEYTSTIQLKLRLSPYMVMQDVGDNSWLGFALN